MTEKNIHRRIRHLHLLPCLIVSLLLAGCGQKLTTDSRLSTQVADLKDAVKCRHLGNAQVSLPRRLYHSDAAAGTAEDLLVKARNLADEIGADTVVASSGISEGKQSFRLYLCNPKRGGE